MGEIYYYFYKNGTEYDVDLTTNFSTWYKDSAPGAAYVGRLDSNANPTDYYILQNGIYRRIYAWEQPAIDIRAITFGVNIRTGNTPSDCLRLHNICFSRRPYSSEQFKVTIKYYAASWDLGDIEDWSLINSYSTDIDRDDLGSVVFTPNNPEYVRFSMNNQYNLSYTDGVTRALHINIHKNGFPDATDYNLWLGSIYSDDYFYFSNSGTNRKTFNFTKITTPYTNYSSKSILFATNYANTDGYIWYFPGDNSSVINSYYDSLIT